ncbi:MAG: hypothetical protein JXJ04_19815 [Spirochaetales bacterium]|nr:hypothetical protein [Spirochaetales bacterium]
MKKSIPYEHIIALKKNHDLEDVYDIELNNNENLRHYSSLESHFVIYPYSRKLTSKHIMFCPFEEYAADIQSNQRSAYQKIESQFNKVFGILLGIIIIAGFYYFQPQSLLSVEILLSLLGAYFIGKELWDDLENIIIKITRCLRIRYQPSYYSYKLAGNSTLAFYARLAKKNRYKKVMLLPEEMDFIAQSNSQTLRLFFKKGSYREKTDDTLHIMSIHIDRDVADEFLSQGFMFGVKMSFNKNLLGITLKREFFQSFDNNIPGCLDKSGQWCDNAVFTRISLTIGRIKFFISDAVIHDACIIEKKRGD